MIDLNDLRHSINRALNLGRYQIVVKTAGGEQVPASITLDLLERDDDLFGLLDADSLERVIDRVNTALDAEDDHGPTIPAQLKSVLRGQFPDPSPRIYEFAVDEMERSFSGRHIPLENVMLTDAPNWKAAVAADWVHVFDRVTRERRTLKRPEPDAVLKGLSDVAADLRAKRGDPVEPPFGCYTPPVGPLTSVEGLKVGDVLRVIDGGGYMRANEIVTLCGIGDFPISNGGGRVKVSWGGGNWCPNRFAFVARPGVWMPWSGGENPVPGMRVKVLHRDDDVIEAVSGEGAASDWTHELEPQPGDIVSYMVIDTGKASSDT